MVMYESDGESLTLNYDVANPSIGQIIEDILNAPLEYGETFQDKKACLKEQYLIVKANITEKAFKKVCEGVADFGFKSTKFLEFKVPEVSVSEQAELMR